jgi:hypothetical protein
MECIEEAVDEVTVRISGLSICGWFAKELDAETLRCIIVAPYVSKDDGVPVTVKLYQATTHWVPIGWKRRMHNEVNIRKTEKVHVSTVLATTRVYIVIVSAYREVAKLRVSWNGNSHVAEKTPGAKINLGPRMLTMFRFACNNDSFLHETDNIDKWLASYDFRVVAGSDEDRPLLDRVVPIAIATIQIGVKQLNGVHGVANAAVINRDSLPNVIGMTYGEDVCIYAGPPHHCRRDIPWPENILTHGCCSFGSNIVLKVIAIGTPNG